MGLVYANAGMFRCALRWYREIIASIESEPNRHPGEDVYSWVGYCLYSLGPFEEAMSWLKSCIGILPTVDVVCRALIGYEAQLAGGSIQKSGWAGNRVKYTVSAIDPIHAQHTTPRLIAALKTFVPFEEVYIDWISYKSPIPSIELGGYYFKVEFCGWTLQTLKMILIFAICAQADIMIERRCIDEARALLKEAAMLEPQASIVWERIRSLPEK